MKLFKCVVKFSTKGNGLVVFFFLIGFFFSNEARAFWGSGTSLDSKTKEAVKAEMLNRSVDISPRLTNVSAGFGIQDGLEYYYVKSATKIFLQNSKVPAKIIAFDFKGGGFLMELHNDKLGSGKIRYFFKKEDLKGANSRFICDILISALSNENHLKAFCNKETRVCHIFSSNHIPDRDRLVVMDINKAKEAGYRKCGFCFERMIDLPEIGVERNLAFESSARFRFYYPISNDSEKQNYLDTLGKRILGNWPLKLLGYSYSFVLVDGPETNASALPAGKIFIQSGLFDSLESEDELEAVLCHEIAHVEKRHILKEYKNQVAAEQGAVFWGAIAAGMAAGVASSSNKSYGPAVIGGFALLGVTAIKIHMQGYSKEFEREADMLTALYFETNNKPKKALRAVFKKLGYKNLVRLGGPDPKSVTHPQLSERIERVEKTSFEYLGEKGRYILERKRKTPVQLNLFYHRICQKEICYKRYLGGVFVVQRNY
jgi:hypothetical protein